MERELIINSGDNGVEVALLEDKQLVELHQENKNNAFTVGDIFLGEVRKVMPGLNAAFVNVGYQKDAFLHYSDLGANIKTALRYVEKCLEDKQKTHVLNYFRFDKEIIKGGKIVDALEKKQKILVQVLKEPISTKGPRLTSEITIPGRYMVLVPFSNTVGISRKIMSAEERKRLKNLIESIRPKNFGVVVRTAAQEKSVAQLHEDLNGLVDKWEQIFTNLKGKKPPAKILGELDKTSSILRDVMNDSFNKIIVSSDRMLEETKDFVANIFPGKENIVAKHTSRAPIFDHYNITRQIKSSFGKNVSLKGGGYLVLEHTEALHVVDVNSGHNVSSEGSQEDTAYTVNQEAVDEMARQLRLRDIGGIIIIDLIDMKNPKHRTEIYERMKKAMKNDSAKHTILPISKFGLMQITRQRRRPEVTITTSEECPACNGTGRIQATILFAEQLEKEIRYLLNEQNLKTVKLMVHPVVEAYLKRGFMSIQRKWYLKYKKWIPVYINEDYQLTEYHFFNKDGEEIELHK